MAPSSPSRPSIATTNASSPAPTRPSRPWPMRSAPRTSRPRRVHINVAAHSALVEPILGEFREQFERLTLNPPKRPFLSNLTGDWITDDGATDPEYWVRHLRSTVQFCDGISRLLEDPERIFLEVGPGQVLSTLTPARTSGVGAGHDVIATIKHPQEAASDTDFLLGAVGRFWLGGGKLDWAAFAGAPRRRVPLPTYPFERSRHWIDAVPYAASERALPAPAAEAARAPAQIVAPPAAEVTFATRHERILAQLKSIVCKLSGLPIERVDAHATFLELGFDSLFLTQANAAFKKAFKLKMTTRQLIETTPVLDAPRRLPRQGAACRRRDRRGRGAGRHIWGGAERGRRGPDPGRRQPGSAHHQEGGPGRPHRRAGRLYRRADRHDGGAHAQGQGRDPDLPLGAGRPAHRPGLPFALEGDGLSGAVRPGEGLQDLGRRRQRVHRPGLRLRRDLPGPPAAVRGRGREGPDRPARWPSARSRCWPARSPPWSAN